MLSSMGFTQICFLAKYPMNSYLKLNKMVRKGKRES